MLCWQPHSPAIFSNQTSNSGKKWAHFAILKVNWPANVVSGKDTNGLRVTAAAVNLIKSRRVLWLMRFRLIFETISTLQPDGITELDALGLATKCSRSQN